MLILLVLTALVPWVSLTACASTIPSVINKKIHLLSHDTAGINAAAARTNGISYHGGPVMTGGANVYYIYYGDTWSSDTLGQQVLNNLASNIGGSPWWGIDTTYTQGSVHVSSSVKFASPVTVSDSATFGKQLSDDNVFSIVSNTIKNGRLPADNHGVYFVLTASDVTETSGFCTQYCGWHSNGSVSGVDIKYAFVGNAGKLCPNACIAQSKSISGSLGADGMASVVAHELAEAVSDPDLNAWYDSRGYENADKCAWSFGKTYTTRTGALANMKLGGKDYLVQQNWVNAAGGYCSLHYP